MWLPVFVQLCVNITCKMCDGLNCIAHSTLAFDSVAIVFFSGDN